MNIGTVFFPHGGPDLTGDTRDTVIRPLNFEHFIRPPFQHGDLNDIDVLLVNFLGSRLDQDAEAFRLVRNISQFSKIPAIILCRSYLSTRDADQFRDLGAEVHYLDHEKPMDMKTLRELIGEMAFKKTAEELAVPRRQDGSPDTDNTLNLENNVLTLNATPIQLTHMEARLVATVARTRWAGRHFIRNEVYHGMIMRKSDTLKAFRSGVARKIAGKLGRQDRAFFERVWSGCYRIGWKEPVFILERPPREAPPVVSPPPPTL